LGPSTATTPHASSLFYLPPLRNEALGGHSHGIVKTHLQHLFTALATNILRVVRWLEGIPFAKTRTSRFAALAA
jgi:hypothetical protein